MPRGKPKTEKIDRDLPTVTKDPAEKILRAPKLRDKKDMINKQAAKSPWWTKMHGVLDANVGFRKTRDVPNVSVRERVVERRTAAFEAEESALKQAPDDDW